MRVHDSQAYRKMDVTRERISCILELREKLLTIQTGFSLVNADSGQVLWTYMGRKMLPPSTSLPVVGKIAGVNTTSLGRYLHSMTTRARWAEGFHDELNGHVFDLERDGLCQVVPCP